MEISSHRSASPDPKSPFFSVFRKKSTCIGKPVEECALVRRCVHCERPAQQSRSATQQYRVKQRTDLSAVPTRRHGFARDRLRTATITSSTQRHAAALVPSRATRRTKDQLLGAAPAESFLGPGPEDPPRPVSLRGRRPPGQVGRLEESLPSGRPGQTPVPQEMDRSGLQVGLEAAEDLVDHL
jgi:hypothetical protein